MILLDTSIVSEVMAPSAPPVVIDWLNGQETITLYLSTITLAEIGYGLCIPNSAHSPQAAMPPGRATPKTPTTLDPTHVMLDNYSFYSQMKHQA